MKLLSSLLMVTIVTTLMAFSCSKDDAAITTNIDGSWRVSSYWDKKDETSKFTGYTFTYSNGTITATKAGVIVTGTWSESSSRFIINFGSDPVLSSINKDWLIVDKTATVINLKDDNPLRDEKITFTKN